MRVPSISVFKESHAPDVRETSVRVFHPDAGQKHKRDVLRYFVLAIAFFAVVLLIAIALYYTQRSSIHFLHAGVLAPAFSLRV